MAREVCLKSYRNMADKKKDKAKKRTWGVVLLLFLMMAGMSVSCSSSHNLCPAYGSKYKVEPLPY